MPLPFRSTLPIGGAGTSPRGQTISKNVANAPKTEPTELTNNSQSAAGEQNEDDLISRRLLELQEELFISLKEDISDWIVKTLGDASITAENFIHDLDTGVILCRLSLAIEKKAKECYEKGTLKEPLPDYKLHCNKTAKSGTWFARDNTTNFLKWCRAYGMTDETLFDSEDLVAHHHERQVIYCLMELARLGARFGLEPPSLISFEKEIDSELTPPRTPPQPVPSVPVEIVPKEKSPSHTPHPQTPLPPPPAPPPSLRQPIKSISSSRSSTVSSLDSEVNRVSHKCKCQEYVNKLSEGVYNVFGKRVFIRLLKGKHLMVRVGGGWDTFENYLLHHDPIQVFEFHQNSHDGPVHSTAYSKPDFNPGAFNGYLVIRSKYKSNSFCS